MMEIIIVCVICHNSLYQTRAVTYSLYCVTGDSFLSFLYYSEKWPLLFPKTQGDILKLFCLMNNSKDNHFAVT